MGNEKRRITQHAGRFNRRTKQVFGKRHNGRETTANAPHIDASLSVNNIYSQWRDTVIDENGTERKIGFEECEKLFYKEHFSDGLEARNERYRKQGHHERCQTTDDLLNGRKTAPDEEIVQLGNKEHSVDAETLFQVFNEYLEWHAKTFGNIEFVDIALHVDEPNMAPHIHARKVFIGHDKDGNEIPNQSIALEEMGIERPNPNEPTSRHNNAKMTYTKMCREKILEICREHQIEFEEEPKEASQSGLAFTEYKFRQAEKKLKEAELKVTELEDQVATLSSEKQTLEAKVEILSSKCDIEAEELEALLQDKIKAAAIKKPLFGADKEVETYHKASLVQAQNIADNVSERSRDGRSDRLKAQELKDEAEAIKTEYETKLASIQPLYDEAAALKDSYETQLSELEQTVNERAQEIADTKFNEFLHHTQDADKLAYAEDFLSQIDFENGTNALDIFNQQYEEILESILEAGAHHGLRI